MHCDTLTACYADKTDLCRNRRHWDLARGRRYAPWCQVMAVWVPDTLRGTAAFRYVRRVLEFARRQEKQFPQQMLLVRHAADLQAAAETNRCAVLLAVENGAALGGRADRVAQLASWGVRVVTLTWNGDNELGHGCLSSCREGLTACGRQVLRELCRFGMVPDVSHLNEAGFWDVATQTEQPFIASHSVSQAVLAHPRNLTDAQFGEIRRRGGLVGVNFCGDQLGEASFEAIYRHLSHFWELNGEATVAVGGDLDGTALPEGWQGIAVYEQLEAYLQKRHIPQKLLDRFFFQNAADFFASSLQSGKNELQ